MLTMDSNNQVERKSNVDENIVYNTMQNEVNLSSLHSKKEKKITELFHIKI